MRSVRLLLCLFVATFVLVDRHAGTAESVAPRRDAIFARRGYIKILLPAVGSQVTVSGVGGLQVTDGSRTANSTTGRVSISGSGNTLTASESGKELASGSKLLLGSTRAGSNVTLPSGTYRGMIEFTRRGGATRAVNILLIDDWLKGVLPAEIGGDSAPEALKAQAVAARSEAIFRLLKPPHDAEGYDFCTGVHCQAYKGMKVEKEAANKACDETLGVVLIADGDVMNGVYHNVCGGVTAGAEDVWDSKPMPGLTAVYDAPGMTQPNLSTDTAVAQFLAKPPASVFCDCVNPGCAEYAKKYYRWSKTMSAAELSRACGLKRIKEITVVERRPSGRVRKLTVTGESGTKTIDKELPIRNMFGLWSGLFVVNTQKSGDYVQSATFTGAGNGHGVGLCQHGARELAVRGATYEQILGHYYRGAAIQKIYRP